MKERIFEKYKDYKNALCRLIEALNLQDINDVIIDGIIQRFEFTFELSWKLMKEYLKHEGIEVNSPRSTIREAFSIGLIENGDKWISMLTDRNKTSHIYDEDESREIYLSIKNIYADEFKTLLNKFDEIVKGL
ncbi:nucleotidyltransferase substrate binding protein [Fonticella tunisiensis]|uniref:Nucleotidyltransferase substrate binding protein (TIGR01987 family) n=1 Tax=Fonticella tunisiensis TaxID=1096341 RepID=A0A4R7KUS1_9CLOT|nr:nucleotidyltransferase substrate binding protein [Fonticella tunisiensis]TDT63342.1 nucleotidyltransferase substrate binding protein (TIGR01987 family) [Fonticella tunisiensis]